jgi:hypothetical protein
MKMMNAAELSDLHARMSISNTDHTPTLARCFVAARAGRLWHVDTSGAGHDGLSIGDDAKDVLSMWASATVGPVDGVGDAARFAKWKAQRVTIV